MKELVRGTGRVGLSRLSQSPRHRLVFLDHIGLSPDDKSSHTSVFSPLATLLDPQNGPPYLRKLKSPCHYGKRQTIKRSYRVYHAHHRVYHRNSYTCLRWTLLSQGLPFSPS